MVYHHEHNFPCLHCQPQSYIRMVQNLIERCLCFHMTRDDCIEALAKHASIQPIVTLTVWKELLKENKSFFQAYNHLVSPTPRPPNNRPTNQRMFRVGRKKALKKSSAKRMEK